MWGGMQPVAPAALTVQGIKCVTGQLNRGQRDCLGYPLGAAGVLTRPWLL